MTPRRSIEILLAAIAFASAALVALPGCGGTRTRPPEPAPSASPGEEHGNAPRVFLETMLTDVATGEIQRMAQAQRFAPPRDATIVSSPHMVADDDVTTRFPQLGPPVTTPPTDPFEAALAEVHLQAKPHVLDASRVRLDLDLELGRREKATLRTSVVLRDGELYVHPTPIEARGRRLVFAVRATILRSFRPDMQRARARILRERDDVLREAKAPPLTFALTHDSVPERQTREQLQRIATRYDVTPWLFTTAIEIDEDAIPHSHPVLTLHTRHLKDDDQLLSTFLHEQLHWFADAHASNLAAAVNELRARFPRLPVGYPEGAQSEQSSYEHLVIIHLEHETLARTVGNTRADQVFGFWERDHYRALYRLERTERDAIEAVVARNGLMPGASKPL